MTITQSQHNLSVLRLNQLRKEKAYHVKELKRIKKEKKRDQKDDAAKHS